MDIWIDKKDIIVEKSLNIGVSGNARAKLKIPINRGYIEYIIINDIPIKNIKNYENRIKELEELETDLKGQELDLYHREKKNARVKNYKDNQNIKDLIEQKRLLEESLDIKPGLLIFFLLLLFASLGLHLVFALTNT